MVSTRSTGLTLPWLRRALALLAVVLVATGCQAEFDVMVEVEEDGSGQVRIEMAMDQEAVDGLLDNALALTDLADAGWRIEPPTRTESGQTIRAAEKAFGTPEQFSEVMADLAGEGGVISDFALRREQSFGRVDYELTGSLDPGPGLASFSDEQLEQALNRSVISIITEPPYNVGEEDIAIRVSVVLPGQLQTDSAAGAAAEDRSTGNWAITLEQTQPVDVSLATTRRSTSAQVLRGVAVVAGVLAGLIAFGQLLRIISSLRRPKRPEKPRPTDARGRPAEPLEVAPELQPEPEEPQFAGYRVVALDGHGVLYKEANPVQDLLIPFVREWGSAATDEELDAKARLLTLGRITTLDFWSSLGLQADVNELDAAYVARQQLMPGVVKYLRAVRSNEVRVACVTDDCPAWAVRLRTAHSLESLVDPWIISGSVGEAKPGPSIFEVLRRKTGEPASAILVVDDDLDNLDVARSLGFGTAWFDLEGEWSEARDHDLWRNFDVAADMLAASGGEVPPSADAPVS